MPRMKLSKTEQEKREMLAVIRSHMIMAGIDRDSAARRMGVSISTYQRRMQHPDTFTIRELMDLGLSVDVRGK